MGLITARRAVRLPAGAALALGLGLSLAAGAVGVGSLAPPDAGSVEELDLGLARLGQHRRLMLVGAHPDDESGTLLAHVTWGLGGEAAYLSLSRGEGGQNRLGPELGVDLGVLRTGELLAARAIDRAEQLFTRAIDFGYSRSFDEALDRWPEEELLRDVVRAVRRFRPQVMVAVFPPTAAARHAQHQMSGHLARLAFSAAADPDAFPELAAEGLAPYAPERLFQLAWWRGATPTFTVEVGELAPSGRSVRQVGGASRSQHRSQDMGTLEELGAITLPVEWVAGGDAAPSELFDGIDTRLPAIAAALPEPLGPQIEALLESVELLAEEARAGLSPSRRGSLVPLLTEIVETLSAAERRLEIEPPAPGDDRVRQLLGEKRRLAGRLLAAAAGVVFDARTATDEVRAGDVLAVELELWNAGSEPLALPEVPVVLWSPGGWTSLAGLSFADDPERRQVAAGEVLERTAELRIAADAPPSMPDYLRRPPHGDLYDWSEVDAEDRGTPFGRSPLLARLTLEVAGTSVRLERPVVSRQRDRERGEVRRPLRLLPALELRVSPGRALFRRGDEQARELSVSLLSHAGHPLRGVVGAEVPAGWPPVAPRPFELGAGAREVLALPLTPPANGVEPPVQSTELPLTGPPLVVPAASGVARVWARTDDGVLYRGSIERVDYPHVAPQAVPRAAEVTTAQVELILPPPGAIGWVRGGADQLPEVLAEVGVVVELLDGGALLAGDLSRFRTIVVGGVAYETEPALAEANPRLRQWVEEGGLLLVLYQRRPFFAAGWGLLPMALDDDPDRATDETTPAIVLDPEHRLWRHPNLLGEADWQGWVQERGLYFPSSWDPAFAPQLAFTGALGEEVRGGLLIAPLGRGLYVYTGLALFRQLPAGVPGAFRLLANLLALAAEEVPDAVDSGP